MLNSDSQRVGAFIDDELEPFGAIRRLRGRKKPEVEQSPTAVDALPGLVHEVRRKQVLADMRGEPGYAAQRHDKGT